MLRQFLKRLHVYDVIEFHFCFKKPQPRGDLRNLIRKDSIETNKEGRSYLHEVFASSEIRKFLSFVVLTVDSV